jgi:hypothetical protein
MNLHGINTRPVNSTPLSFGDLLSVQDRMRADEWLRPTRMTRHEEWVRATEPVTDAQRDRERVAADVLWRIRQFSRQMEGGRIPLSDVAFFVTPHERYDLMSDYRLMSGLDVHQRDGSLRIYGVTVLVREERM